MILFYENIRRYTSFNIEIIIDLLSYKKFFDIESSEEERHYDFSDELIRNSSNDGQHQMHVQVDYNKLR